MGYISPQGAAPPPGLKKVAEIDVDVDTTEITIEGLDINKDRFYMLFLTTSNRTSSNTNIQLFVEGDTEPANYHCQFLQASGTSINANRGDGSTICWLPAGKRGSSIARLLLDPDGYFRYHANDTRRTGISIRGTIYWGTKKETLNNITEITIQASVTGGLGSGTELTVFGAAG